MLDTFLFTWGQNCKALDCPSGQNNKPNQNSRFCRDDPCEAGNHAAVCCYKYECKSHFNGMEIKGHLVCLAVFSLYRSFFLSLCLYTWFFKTKKTNSDLFLKHGQNRISLSRAGMSASRVCTAGNDPTFDDSGVFRHIDA